LIPRITTLEANLTKNFVKIYWQSKDDWKELKMKKILFLVLITIMSMAMIATLSLSGCKTTTTTVETTAAETTVGETTAAETTVAETTAAAAGEKVTITMWQSSNQAYQDLYEKFAKDFTAVNPNIEVKITLQPTVGFDQKILAAFISGDEPDMMDNVHDFSLEIEQKYGAWANLDNYGVRDWPEVKLMDPNILDSLSYNGKLYGLQFTDQPLALFVRKSWAENVGWGKGFPYIESWSDLIELGKKFTFNDPDKNGKNDTWGYEMFGSLDRNYATVQFEYLMNAAGQELVTKDGKLNINNETGIKALTFMQDAIWKNKISPKDTASYSHVEFYRDVAAGIVGIGRLGSWNLAGWQEKLNNDLVAVPFPPIEKGGKNYASTIYHALVVSVNSKHPKEALKFIQYLLSTEVQTEFYKNQGMSYRPDLDYKNLAKTEQDLFFKDAMLPAKVNRIYLITAAWWTADARAMLARYIQSALIDATLDPAEVLADAEKAIVEKFVPKT
ncbi:MAG: sugar ABC transporter substrate-binding protein, partial [Actinobacteria bacterium]|nr:sugar ABC transporter substrate-binding protein [Actinomycetota bacterium]